MGIRKTFLLLAGCGLLALPASLLAQEASFVSNSELILRLEEMEARLATLDQGGGWAAPSDTYCCGGIGCSRCCGFEGGVDLVFISPVFGRAHNFHAGDNQAIDFDLGTAFRLWGGYVNECGFGIRARYFEYEDGAIANNTEFADLGGIDQGELSVEAEYFDIEVIQRMTLCRWDTTFSGGLRFASIDERFQEIAPGNDVAFTEFDGIGPTFSLEARRPLGCSRLAVFGGLRGALLFGERRYATTNFNEDLEGDDLVTAFEAQLGAEYNRCLTNCGGAQLFIRAAFEAQMYISGGQHFSEEQLQDSAVPEDAYDASADLGLVGFSIGAGIAR